MTTVADINNWINSIAPYDTMEEWDNSGFLVGDMQAPVRRCVPVSYTHLTLPTKLEV